jgi:hypothetical protein
MKRTRPQDARKALRKLWSRAAVYSCADGTLRIEPAWGKKFNNPGVLTRMHSAYMVQCLLDLPLKRINWMKRTPAALVPQPNKEE